MISARSAVRAYRTLPQLVKAGLSLGNIARRVMKRDESTTFIEISGEGPIVLRLNDGPPAQTAASTP